jgi:hypothetical protein
MDIIYAKILEITERNILLNCLINEQDKTFQIRKFDIEPFIGAVTLQINNFVQITVQTSVGERKINYTNATRHDLPTIFERENLLTGLENTAFFIAITPSKDDH